MSRRAMTLLIACGCLLASSSFGAEGEAEFVVIVHTENSISSVPRQFVADAFLKKVTRWDDGHAIQPVDRRPNATVRRSFSKRVLRRTVAAVRSYWQQRIFSGRGVPPPELDSDAAVVTYVLTHRGAVGYVERGTDLRGARPIRVD